MAILSKPIMDTYYKLSTVKVSALLRQEYHNLENAIIDNLIEIVYTKDQYIL